jgi:hypothetical protein
MTAIAVRAKDMRAGDVLYSRTDAAALFSQWNAHQIYASAFSTLAEGYPYPEFMLARLLLMSQAQHIEHVSYGPFKARIVTAGGAVVLVRRNMMVAVLRGSA